MSSYNQPLLIVNPVAGRGWSKALTLAVIRSLREWLPSLRVIITEAPRHATRLAEEATRKGCGLVIVAGGDGTINEVINGMVGGEAVLAILPCGTGNSLAREIGLPLRPLDSVKALVGGEVRDAYLGCVGKHYFCLMVGIGFDGFAVRSVSYRLKRLWGRTSYLIAGFLSLLRYGYPEFSIIADGKRLNATTAIIAKSKYYASCFQVAPLASLFSPRFQVCVFKGHGPWAYIKFVFTVMLGTHTRLADVSLIFAEEIEIKINKREGLMAHIDGEPVSTVPSFVRISKQRIKVLFPGSKPKVFVRTNRERSPCLSGGASIDLGRGG